MNTPLIQRTTTWFSDKNNPEDSFVSISLTTDDNDNGGATEATLKITAGTDAFTASVNQGEEGSLYIQGSILTLKIVGAAEISGFLDGLKAIINEHH